MGEKIEYETQITDLQNKIRTREEELRTANQTIEDNKGINQENIDRLTHENEELHTQNENLTQRIMTATTSINKAADNLETLMNSVPNDASQRDINNLFQQIEKSIQDISNSLQSAPEITSSLGGVTELSPGGVAKKEKSKKLNYLQEIKLQNDDGSEISLPLNKWIAQLKNKINKASSPHYQETLKKIINAEDMSDIPGILQKGLTIKNNNIMGGNNMKGGFLYNPKAKRKSISSFLNNSRTKKIHVKSFNRSSKRSSKRTTRRSTKRSSKRTTRRSTK
jgi:hypothetical protein